MRLRIMYRLKRIIVWIMRMHCCRGFGIQSPTDYAFVRYVVNEHYPFYSYSDLKSLLPDIDDETRRLCCLYFRMANYLQPDVIVCTSGDRAYSAYLQAGCHRAAIVDQVKFGSMAERDDRGVVGLFITPVSDERFVSFVTGISDKLDGRSIMIVEGIHAGRTAKRRWKAVREDERVGVTFDLYYAGIVFFDKRRYKQHYKINF